MKSHSRNIKLTVLEDEQMQVQLPDTTCNPVDFQSYALASVLQPGPVSMKRQICARSKVNTEHVLLCEEIPQRHPVLLERLQNLIIDVPFFHSASVKSVNLLNAFYTDVDLCNVEIFELLVVLKLLAIVRICLLYTSPSPRDLSTSRMPSSA